MTSFNKFRTNLQALHEALTQTFFFWSPVWFGLGISIYFLLPKEPSLLMIKVLLGSVAPLTASTYFIKPHLLRRFVMIFTLCLAGLACAGMRTESMKAPVFPYEQRFVELEATLSELHPLEHGYRIMLEQPELQRVYPRHQPKKIRLLVRTIIDNVEVGDRVHLKAILSPPSVSILPGGYDFARYAYFEQIGAIGFAVSPVITIERPKNPTLRVRINQLRQKTASTILFAAKDPQEGAIATALLVGEKNALNNTVLEAVRTSGIAHILAISGMHLALIAGVSFYLLRALFALSSTLTLRYSIKKWAICGSILFSFGYLLLSGAPISAIRSFVMTGLFLLTILIDRNASPLRSVTIAAWFILLTQPESLMTPSFQMSFSAVIGLICAYQWASTRSINHHRLWWMKPYYFFKSIFFASLVAGLATAPFSIYHFNHFSVYGIFTNLLAIPLTSLWIMPWGMFTVLLVPFGLHQLPLTMMCLGIKYLISVATFIASLPGASIIVPSIPGWGLALMTFGGLFLCLVRHYFRFLGLAPILVGLGSLAFFHSPDLVIPPQGTMFAIRLEDNQLYFSHKGKAKYFQHMLHHHIGQARTYYLQDYFKQHKNSTHHHCTQEGCIFILNDHHIRIAFHPSFLVDQPSTKPDILINLSSLAFNLRHTENPPITITRSSLTQDGTHLIWLNSEATTTTTLKETLPFRPWNAIWLYKRH